MKKRDKYTLPSGTLQKAFHAIKNEGRTRAWVAQMIMSSIAGAIERDPKLRRKSPYAQIPVLEAQRILEERLRLCDPACAEHADYQKELEYLRSRKKARAIKARRHTDDEFRRADNARMNEYRKERYANDPAYRERRKEDQRRYYAKKRADPQYRLETRAKRRARYLADRAKPDYAERTRERNRRYREKRKERMASDPAYAAKIKAQRAEQNRRYAARVRLRQDGIELDD